MSLLLNRDRAVTLAFHVRRWWRTVWISVAIGHALLVVLALRGIYDDTPSRLRFIVEPVSWFLLPVSAVFCCVALNKLWRGPDGAVSFVLTGAQEKE